MGRRHPGWACSDKPLCSAPGTTNAKTGLGLYPSSVTKEETAGFGNRLEGVRTQDEVKAVGLLDRAESLLIKIENVQGKESLSLVLAVLGLGSDVHPRSKQETGERSGDSTSGKWITGYERCEALGVEKRKGCG